MSFWGCLCHSLYAQVAAFIPVLESIGDSENAVETSSAEVMSSSFKSSLVEEVAW